MCQHIFEIRCQFWIRAYLILDDPFTILISIDTIDIMLLCYFVAGQMIAYPDDDSIARSELIRDCGTVLADNFDNICLFLVSQFIFDANRMRRLWDLHMQIRSIAIHIRQPLRLDMVKEEIEVLCGPLGLFEAARATRYTHNVHPHRLDSIDFQMRNYFTRAFVNESSIIQYIE